MQFSDASVCAPLLDLQKMCCIYGPSLSLGEQLCRLLHLETILLVQLLRDSDFFIRNCRLDEKCDSPSLWRRLRRTNRQAEHNGVRLTLPTLPKLPLRPCCLLRSGDNHIEPNANNRPRPTRKQTNSRKKDS